MTLLRADELLSSPIVANATMNRGRGLSGFPLIAVFLMMESEMADRTAGMGSSLLFRQLCAVLLGGLLLLMLLVAPIQAQHSSSGQTAPKRIPLPTTITMHLKKLPMTWSKTLPKPRKVSRITESGIAYYAVTWTGVQLWDALPPDQKKRIKKTIDMERYFWTLLRDDDLLSSPVTASAAMNRGMA